MIPAPETLLDLFRGQVQKSRYRTALRYEAGGVFRSISWEGWSDKSDQVARGLVGLGVDRGARVAIVARTRPRWAIVDVGIMKAGAVTTPIYPTLPPREVCAILRDSGATVALVETLEMARRLLDCGRPHGLREVIVFEADGDSDAGVTGWDDFVALSQVEVSARNDELETRCAAARPDDLATIVYTSGTSGEPKGVELTHGAFTFEMNAIRQVFPVGPDDTQLLFLPLAHIFARMTLFLQMRVGFTTAFSHSIGTVGVDFGRIKPTFIVAVPRLYEKLHEVVRAHVEEGGDIRKRVFDWAFAARRDKAKGVVAGVKRRYADRLVFEGIRERLGGRIRFLVSGAAPLGVETAEFFFAAGLPLLTGYGLTETAGAATANLLGNHRLGTVGRALPGVSVAIGDDAEILIRGPNVMRGYHDDEKGTARVIDDEGWLHTGDLGCLDADGFLTITGRKKDLLITAGGKTIAPRKLEAVLEESPFVAHAVVIADRRPYAVALIDLDEEQTRAWARDKGVSGDFRTLIEHPKVHELVTGLVDALNSELAGYETIKHWAALPKKLSQASGELTPTLKVRRGAVEKAHRSLINNLYR
ncbi:MAG: long-chain fatty acid--CoA ligase [Deltaproteobacteria bacterium]|nr:MAG: long-chain fatty acid--CoA ligase [Deltaproteobacteria bacterium]